jgi:malate synthase
MNTITIDRPTAPRSKPARTAPAFETVQPHLEVTAPYGERYEEILTPEALEFLAALHDRFAHTRHELLAIRLQTRVDAANGRDPKFLPETEWIRNDPSWRVAGAGPGLEDRRVEITGPTDRKMAINALNSGAKVWLADHEDATSPTWGNVVEGQLSLRDFLRGSLEYTTPEGKEYRVTATQTPTIVFRPRGWHLVEKHLRFHDRAGRAMHASGCT